MVKTYKTSKDKKRVSTSLDNFKTRKIRLGRENYQCTTGNVVTIEQEKPTKVKKKKNYTDFKILTPAIKLNIFKCLIIHIVKKIKVNNS